MLFVVSGGSVGVDIGLDGVPARRKGRSDVSMGEGEENKEEN